MREKLILDIIREKENVSLKTIALKLDVSERTIRNEITSINKTEEMNGFKIINIRGKGYSLVIKDDFKFNNYIEKIDKFLESDFSLGVEERTNKVLEIFLIKNRYITIDYIAEEMGYSRGTIIKDLKIVEKKLKKLKLNLIRRTSLGLKIEGDEITIRKALSSYLYSNKGNPLINNNTMALVFGNVKKIFIEEILREKIQISNIGIENIFYHLKILILRFSSGSFIEDYSHKECLDKRFEEIAMKICNCIKDNLKINVPNNEIEYLAAQMFYKSNVVVQENNIKVRAEKDIEEILKGIDKLRYTNFSKDEELKNNLLIHLCALINRVRTNTQLKNPYFDEVNTRYSAIVLIAVNFTDEFCRRWDMFLLKDEIAFIAIHFATHFEKARFKKLKNIKKIAVISPNNGGIEYFIKIRLEETFRSIVIDNYSPIEVWRLKENEYDFVITTVDIEERLEYPVFVIKNIFNEMELEQIVKTVEKRIEGATEDKEKKIEEILFKRRKGGVNVKYKEFLKEDARKLTELGLVEEDFEKLVLIREDRLSTAYKNNIAAPHGIEMNARKNVISVTVFENSIQWGDKKVDIVMLIGMKKDSLNLHTEIANKLFHLTTSEKDRERVRKCKNISEFRKIFKEI